MDGAIPDATDDRIDVLIESPQWLGQSPNVADHVRAAAGLALQAAGRADAQLCVLLVDDASVRELNRRFRGQDRPTNVLSFPMRGPDEALGDVALAYETVAREAAEQDKLLIHHTQHLTLHGVLHLLGFDHETEDDAATMESLEIKLLGSLGIMDPYRSHTGD